MDLAAQQHLIERESRCFQEQLQGLIDSAWPVSVQQVIEHFHAHLFDPELTVGGSCRACGIRSGRFRLVFRRYCRTTMRCYIEDKRMLAALRLLTFEGLATGAIAFGIGYENYRTFGRAFKRHFGQVPSRFRRELREQMQEDSSYVPAGIEREVFERLVRA